MAAMKKKEWELLTPSTQDTLSLVKAGVILNLLVLLAKKDCKSTEILAKKKFILSFRGGERLSWILDCRKGRLSAREGRSMWPSLKLYSPKERGIGAMLSQKKAFVLPFPGFWSTGKALNCFKYLASRLPLFLGGEEGKKNPELQTELLLEAALNGVCQVGNYDNYVSTRIQKMGRGIIKVEVLEAKHLTRFIRIENRRLCLQNQCSEEVSASLTFQNQETARALLLGNLRAMSALGDSRIKIRGRLPLIQGIFPLLDRFSYLMSIK